MTGEYKPEAWFWEFLKMYLKLLIMCCLTFYEYDIPNKVKKSSTFYFFFSSFIYKFLHFKLIDFVHSLLGVVLWFLAVLVEALFIQDSQLN